MLEKHSSIIAALELKLNDTRVRTVFLLWTLKYCLACVRCDKLSATVTKHSGSPSLFLFLIHSLFFPSSKERGAFHLFPTWHRSISGGRGTGCHQDNTSKHKRQIQRTDFFSGTFVRYSINQRHCITTVTVLLERTLGYPSLYRLVDIACKFHSWLVTNYYKWNKPRDCSSALDMHCYRQLSQTQTTRYYQPWLLGSR